MLKGHVLLVLGTLKLHLSSHRKTDHSRISSLEAWCGADGTILKSEYISVEKERYPKGGGIYEILKDEANKKAVEGSTCQAFLCSIN